MEIRANYIIVGVFTLAMLLGGLLFTLWSARESKDVPMAEYEVSFSESVKGLSVGNDVLFVGIKVGTVSAIKISETTPGAVKVLLNIAADTPVRADSEARLDLQGLTGISMISISGGTAASPLNRPRAGEVGEIRYVPSPFTAVVNRAPETLARANALLQRMERLLSDDNIAHFDNSMASLDRFTAALANRSDSLEAFLSNAEKTSADMRTLVGTADKILSKDVQGATNALGDAAKRMDDTMKILGPGLQRFSGDGLSQLRALLVDARNLVNTLNQLSRKLDNDPRRFLFGEPVQEYQSR